MIIKVEAGQSLLDIANKYTGTVLSAFALSIANEISLTDDLEPGKELMIPDDIVKDHNSLSYYKRGKLSPATALQPGLSYEGIGYWRIARTFKVN